MKKKGYLKHITKRGRELLARKDMQPSIKLFEKATKASRAHSKLASESLDKYGDHGSHISGVLRDHFPKDVKDKLRKHARDINTHADAAYYARPKGVRNTTMQALAGAVATKTGTGFYGPQANPSTKGASPHNAMWLATVGFIRNLQKANRAQIEDAITGAKQGMNDYALPANERKYYKVVLPILRKELRDFGPRKKNPANRFTKKQLDTLRKEYGNIQRIDPGLQGYAKLVDFLDNLPPAQLKQLEKAHIKFVSGLARNRLIRSENPVTKKRRTAKQKAATKKLVAFNKARRGKKKARRNPRRVASRGVALRRKIRAKRPVRTTLKKSHLWLAFKCNNVVRYLGLNNAGRVGWFTSKSAALLFRTRGHASAQVEKIRNREKGTYAAYGAAPENTTAAKIKAHCDYETGKA